MNLLTLCVLRELIEWPGIAADLPYWRNACASRHDAEVDLAMRLNRLVKAHRRKACQRPDKHLLKFIRVAVMHANFRKLAAELFDRFLLELPAAPSAN
jgi:hypothetical protein